MHLFDLPYDVLGLIVAELGVQDLLSLQRTSRFLYELVQVEVRRLDFADRRGSVNALLRDAASFHRLQHLHLRRRKYWLEEDSSSGVRRWELLLMQRLRVLAVQCPELECLDVSFCPITDEILHLLIAVLPRLRTLDLSYTSVTDVSAARLAAHAASLRLLRLRGCARLSPCAIRELCARRPGLTVRV